jgi:hypothetical protein
MGVSNVWALSVLIFLAGTIFGLSIRPLVPTTVVRSLSVAAALVALVCFTGVLSVGVASLYATAR